MISQDESSEQRDLPRSFFCPLTMEVMVDPVIDAEGNTYERNALLQWLSQYGLSPVSRQPLNAKLVVPNFALRDTIHEVMGKAWVSKRTEEVESQYTSFMDDSSSHSNSTEMDASQGSLDSSGSHLKHLSKYRAKMQCYLQKLSRDVGGGKMSLDLDENGVCMFNCQNMNHVVEVPANVGFFFISTVVSVPTLNEEMKDMMLELNRLQSETRGGILSIKKYEAGNYDIFFSYSDRIDEISAADFCNIVPNFVETATRLKSRFLGDSSPKQPPQGMQPPVETTTSRQQVGMAAKLL